MLNAQLLQNNKPHSTSPNHASLSMDRVPPGTTVRIHSVQPGDGDSSRHLQAYGLIPGRTIRVLAHKPLTIIQVEQTELALEPSVARLVLVEPW